MLWQRGCRQSTRGKCRLYLRKDTGYVSTEWDGVNKGNDRNRNAYMGCSRRRRRREEERRSKSVSRYAFLWPSGGRITKLRFRTINWLTLVLGTRPKRFASLSVWNGDIVTSTRTHKFTSEIIALVLFALSHTPLIVSTLISITSFHPSAPLFFPFHLRKLYEERVHK